MRRAAAALCVRALAGSVTAAIALLCAPGARPAAEPDAGSVNRRGIRELLERPALHIDGRPFDPRAVGRFYRARDFAPAWEANHDGLERASLLLQALATAYAHGLDPERYHLSAIRARQTRPGGRSTIEIDLLLTDAFLRYATDVRAGRRPVGYVQADWAIPASPFDAVSALTQGVRRPAAFAALLASLPPPTKDYARLVEGLRRYRAIAARNGWPPTGSGRSP